MWTDATVRVTPIHHHVERRGSQERGQGGSESPGHQESLTRKHSLLPSCPGNVPHAVQVPGRRIFSGKLEGSTELHS